MPILFMRKLRNRLKITKLVRVTGGIGPVPQSTHLLQFGEREGPVPVVRGTEFRREGLDSISNWRNLNLC